MPVQPPNSRCNHGGTVHHVTASYPSLAEAILGVGRRRPLFLGADIRGGCWAELGSNGGQEFVRGYGLAEDLGARRE